MGSRRCFTNIIPVDINAVAAYAPFNVSALPVAIFEGGSGKVSIGQVHIDE
jgi:hypothetical protein